MNKKEKKKNKELFEKFKSVELTPLPYFSHELLSLPDDLAKEMRQIADRHNCTVSYVISHFLEDFFLKQKTFQRFRRNRSQRFQRTNHICLSKKIENLLPEFHSMGKMINGQKIMP